MAASGHNSRPSPGISRCPLTDLVIAIAELVANTLARSDGPGTVTFWASDEAGTTVRVHMKRYQKQT